MGPFKRIIGKRKQLFEMQDQQWCPTGIRDGTTDYLAFCLRFLSMYNPVLPWIKRMARASGDQWIDLCAGAGGGSLPLFQTLHKENNNLKLVLTDLYPNSNLVPLSGVSYYQAPVDARAVPQGLKGFRTLFTSLHHLTDDVARKVFEDALKNNQAIGAFEFTERNLFCILMTLPNLWLSFFGVLLVFPWKTSRLVWTYVIPLLPLCSTIDIVLSCFRTRSEEELRELIKGIESDNYEWHIGKEPSILGFSITYIVGLPKGS